ncbi:hypothetical protein Tco_0998436, partial [Tanacetum coccineum]
MDYSNIIMEEYVQYETKRALRNGKVYNSETATYGKIRYVEDINYLRFFETKFPAIVYDDALTFESDFSSEPTVSSQHVDNVNLKNETSLSEFDDGKYNVISDKDLFSYDIFPNKDLQLCKDNDDDKIDCRYDVQFRRTSLTGFPAQSIRSSNAVALDSPKLLILITGTSQSRQYESRKSPTKSLFDVGSRRISIVTVNTKEYHSDVLAIITRIMRRT